MKMNTGQEANTRRNRRQQKKFRRQLTVILACAVLLSTVSALILPAITMEKKPICGMEEHIHGPECYREEKVLICGYPEQVPDDTVPPQSEPAAEPPSEPAPSEPVLTETPPASSEPEEPTPPLPTTVSSDSAGQRAEPDSSPAEEVPLPTDTQPAPTDPAPSSETEPTLPSETEPVPTEQEPPQTDTAPVPTEPEPTAHVHTEACYEIRRVLICGKQEHTHTDACFEQSDPYADVETPADWETTFSDVLHTGSWAEDVIALARTQLGYEESTKNFVWDENGQKLGYSRYGDWYGSAYGDWCAMFLSFCLHYGGVPADLIPPQASCPTWVSQLTELGIYAPRSQPAPGDLLFIDHDADGSADHVALVEDVLTESEETVIHTIEGNCGDAVRKMQYSGTDPVLMGVCPLAQVQKKLAARPEDLTYSLLYEDERMTVTLSLQGLPQILPEDAALVVWELTHDNAPQAYDAAMEKGTSLLQENYQVSGLTLFDFTIISGGQEFTVPDTADVSVSIKFHAPLFSPEALEKSADLQTLILDDLSPELIPAPDLNAAEPASRVSPAPEPEAADAPQPTESATDIAYQSKGLSPVAVMLTNHTQSGTFWKVCRNIQDGSEFTTGSTYLIVSVDGGYALATGNQDAVRVELQPVKGNPDYYTIANVPSRARWVYSWNPGNSSRTFYQRVRTGGGWYPTYQNYYVNPALYQAVIGTDQINLRFAKSNCSACFGLYNGQYYLNYYADGGYFWGSSSRYLYSDDTSYSYDRTADMLILKQVDATLTIPDDAVSQDGSGGPGSATKPDYPGYLSPSGEKIGSYETDAATVDYFSDPATSQLEQYFGAHAFAGITDYEANKADNGKVMMDKSVVYGSDDYGAFSSYEDGTFSVALSGLGQSFVVDQSITTVPLDVLLILDMSNSMNETDSKQRESRAQILVNSINKTMERIMHANPENRVCAVGYNSGAYDLLNLGHHLKGEGGKYFRYTVGANNEFGLPRISIQATGLSGALGPNVPCSGGTYTQMGIAKGYDLLMRNTPNPEDTTYTVTVNGQTVTRPRKPVIILVSDGEPTHCTSHYMDVLRNPYYGDGLGPVINGKGVQGYYTILSANYYKRMVGIHYNNPAAMYTIAFGMKENDTTVLDGSAATNHYRATVMNPTAANIDALKDISTDYSAEVEQALYKMLMGTHNGNPVKVGSSWDLISSLGNPHCYVPVLKSNPYIGDYAYTDKAYLNNTGNDGLDAAFEDIINLNTVYEFSYETMADKHVQLSDPIGEGMELKGDPVLRINGQNHTHTGKEIQGNTTVYTYSGVVAMDAYSGRTVDLSTIRVKVTTQNGVQTVTMEVPPGSLPTYTADATTSFFYEALPIRLLYQVGLSPEGQSQIDALQPGQTKVFYTNRYTDSEYAKAILEPSPKNPYYAQSGWECNHQKVSNPTQTAASSLIKSGTAQQIRYDLGNNGKLVITKKEPPAEPVDPVSVSKIWLDYNGESIQEADLPDGLTLPDEIHLTLYRTYLDENGDTIREEVAPNFILSQKNNWRRTFTPEELHAMPGRSYQYYVEELTRLAEFQVSYAHDGVLANTAETPIEVRNRYRYGDVILPATGGPGTFLYTGSGLILVGTAMILYRYILRQKRREGRNHNAS